MVQVLLGSTGSSFFTFYNLHVSEILSSNDSFVGVLCMSWEGGNTPDFPTYSPLTGFLGGVLPNPNRPGLRRGRCMLYICEAIHFV